jgi:hypothetical protein
VDAAELDALRRGLEELPGELREALELRYFAGLRNSDIAAALGVTPRTVERRLERAREKLRSLFTRLGVAPLLLLEARSASAIGVAAPPPTLLPSLLRITESGAALAAVTPTVTLVTLGGSCLRPGDRRTRSARWF